MTGTYPDVTATIGATPLVKLNRIANGLGSTIYAKMESRNPLGSVKDRIGTAMIEKAEQEGLIKTNEERPRQKGA